MENMEKLVNEIFETHRKEIEEISDYIFKNPELGLKEVKSAKYLISILKKYGFTVEENYCGFPTGFRGEFGDDEGPKICFLPEYDALPGYGANKDENGHACGHNWIAATTLGAAIVLSKIKDKFKGKIVVIGTPAEETLGAKVDMVNQGAFDDIDIAFQMHLGAETNIGCKALAIDSLKFEFFGKAAHAAAFPEEGINALDSVNLMFAGVSALRQHVSSDVRIHGAIRNGGGATNTIHDYASCEFMIRAATRENLDKVTDKVINCAKGAAMMTGCTMKLSNVDNSYDNLLNISSLQNLLKSNLEKVGIKNILNGVEKGVGSSDIGNVSKAVPTSYCEMEIETEPNCYVHNENFLKYTNSTDAYKLIEQSVKATVYSSLELYNNKNLMGEIKKEFQEKNRVW